VAELLDRPRRPASIRIVAYEIDPVLARSLRVNLDLCGEVCSSRGVSFSAEVREDFIQAIAAQTRLAAVREPPCFTHAILNPPYFKIPAGSPVRQHMQALGVEVTNMYAAFVAGALALLQPGGELVAITPRSFCNGTYFRSFRRYLLSRASLRRVHLFQSRREAFRDANVLQENLIIHLVKAPPAAVDSVELTAGSSDGRLRRTVLPLQEVVHPDDPEQFIHVEPAEDLTEMMRSLVATLVDLGLSVSTGPVVDFRAREHLRHAADETSVPLLYPTHLADQTVVWPKLESKKPNAIVRTAETARLLIPAGNYVLVKRFTAKEERRRVVASVLNRCAVPGEWIGLENHLNYFHQNGQGLSLDLARGMALFLNSSALDAHFRRFSGHTQVNATDLRNIRYPSRDQLLKAGAAARGPMTQDQIDEIATAVYVDCS
jgi:adenine-specific DNA-methyltransferase